MPNPSPIPSETPFLKNALQTIRLSIDEAIRERGKAIVGLSGGSTPKPVYDALGKEQLDWSAVWIFLVDDRYVRSDDPRSNQFLLRSTLLRNAPIPESQIILPDTTLPLEQCVDLYDRHITDLLSKGPSDLVTLGIGEDGHIASLFPTLTHHAYGPRRVIHTTTDQFDVHDRISVTLPVLTEAKQKIFFLKGESKKRTWDTMMQSSDDPSRWPGKAVMDSGNTTMLLTA